MPNIFDQFDQPPAVNQPPANPFDQFDAPTQAAAGPMPWGDVGTGAMQNAGTDALAVGKETVDSIRHLPSTIKGAVDLGVGGVQHLGEFLGLRHGQTPQMEVASNFMHGLNEDYGTTERFKHKLQEQPVHAVMDILTPLSLARLPWSLSKGERLARRATSVAKNDKIAKAGYKAAEGTNHVFPANDYETLVNKTGEYLAKKGAHPGLTPDTIHLLKEMDRTTGGDMPIRDMMTLRELATTAMEATKPKDRMLAKVMKKRIDQFISKEVPKLAEANKYYARARERERVEKLISTGERKGKSWWTGAGPENAIRRQFENVNSNDKKMRTFTPPVQKAITATAEGTKSGNAARWAGKFAPTSPMAAQTGTSASILGHFVAPGFGEALGPAMWSGGGLARAIATKGTRSRAHKAAALAGEGGKLPIDVNLEGKARLAAVLQQLEEEKRNRGQY